MFISENIITIIIIIIIIIILYTYNYYCCYYYWLSLSSSLSLLFFYIIMFIIVVIFLVIIIIIIIIVILLLSLSSLLSLSLWSLLLLLIIVVIIIYFKQFPTNERISPQYGQKRLVIGAALIPVIAARKLRPLTSMLGRRCYFDVPRVLCGYEVMGHEKNPASAGVLIVVHIYANENIDNYPKICIDNMHFMYVYIYIRWIHSARPL